MNEGLCCIFDGECCTVARQTAPMMAQCDVRLLGRQDKTCDGLQTLPNNLIIFFSYIV